MKKILVFIAFISITCLSFAQPLITANPEAAGVNSVRLSKIDGLFKDYIDKKYTGAAVAIIVKDGKIIYHKAFGKQGDKKAKTDDIFRIASQTKAITSVAVMMLYEEGKFDLDDPLGKYIPEFANTPVLDKFNEKDTTYTTVPAKRKITIRDLLTHTSGIGYAQIGSPEANAIYYKNGIVGGIGVDKIVLADKMKKLGSLPLLHQPGDKWTYGLNTDLLGYLVEVVSGKSLDAFFKERIFTPLGMNDTYFYLPKNKQKRLAQLYAEHEGNVVPAPDTLDINGKMITDYPNTAGTYFSGGGGLSSTAYDYALFMQMLVNGGEYNGKRILSKASVKLMHMKQYDKLGWGDGDFGLGFKIYNDKSAPLSLVTEGSYEWGGMFSSTYWIDPKQKLVAQVMLNQLPNTHAEIHDKFKTMVYAAIE